MNLRLTRHIVAGNLVDGIQHAVRRFALQFQLARQVEPDGQDHGLGQFGFPRHIPLRFVRKLDLSQFGGLLLLLQAL